MTMKGFSASAPKKAKGRMMPIVAVLCAMAFGNADAADAMKPEERLARSVHALVEMLEKEGIGTPNGDRLIHVALTAILQDAGVPDALASMQPATTPTPIPAPNFQWRELTPRVKYCVPGRVQEANLKTMESKIAEFKPDALILDLRYSGDDNYAPVTLFSQALQATGDDNAAMILLVNSNTSRNVELLANLLRRRTGTVAVGGKSAGHTVPRIRRSLDESLALHLPDAAFRRFFDKWPPAPIIPDIDVADASREYAPPVLFTDALSPADDPVLRKAMDLASAIIAFRPHHADKTETAQ